MFCPTEMCNSPFVNHSLLPLAFSQLLEDCTEKLHLNMAARRVFLADGSEALKPEDIPHEADVYVSMGEPFLDPFKKIKGKKEKKTLPPHTVNGLRDAIKK